MFEFKLFYNAPLKWLCLNSEFLNNDFNSSDLWFCLNSEFLDNDFNSSDLCLSRVVLMDFSPVYLFVVMVFMLLVTATDLLWILGDGGGSRS